MLIAPEKESENYAVSGHSVAERTPQSGRAAALLFSHRKTSREGKLSLYPLQFPQIFFTNYSQQQLSPHYAKDHKLHVQPLYKVIQL